MKRKLAMWGGAFLASALVVGAIAAAPLNATTATEPEKEGVDAAAILEAADIKTAEDWAEAYPNEYASFMMNEENDATADYLEEFPYLNVLYAGNAFSKDYLEARGHSYTLPDASVTKRAPAKANCLSCKTPTMSALISSGEVGVYTLAFDEVLALCEESVSCYNCHGNTGDQLVVTNTFLTDALGDDADKVALENQVCGQCHNEYYFDPETKATTLPYTSLETMTPEGILDYYNEMGFSDYTDPLSGVQFIKVQHPEFETYLGKGSPMAMLGYTCADCHMGAMTDAEGNEYASHNLTSPLDNEELIKNDCSNCHADLAGKVAEIQEQAEARTHEIGNALADFTKKLAEAKEAGTVSDEDFAKIAELNRTAVFYWDFVFVENAEGAHNSALAASCLDKAEAALAEAEALLG